jgi:hypothetical protein
MADDLDLQPVEDGLDLQPVDDLGLEPVDDLDLRPAGQKPEKYLAMQAEQKALREKDEGSTTARLFGIAEKIVKPIADVAHLPVRVLQIPEQLAQIAGVQNPPTVTAPALSPQAAQKVVEFVTPGGPAAEGSTGQAVQQLSSDFLSGMTSPAMIGALLAGTKAPVPIGRIFQAEMLAQVPQGIENVATAEHGQDKTKAALELGANVAFPALIEKGIRPKPPRIAPGPAPSLEAGPTPRLQPYELVKEISSTPQGLSAIPVIGKLFDPRGGAKTGVDKAIIANAFSRQVGDTLAAVWFEQAKAKPAPFKVNEAGALETGGFLEDVIRSELKEPGSQTLTPEQRTWINETWKPILEKTTEMLREEKVKGFEVLEGEPVPEGSAYFPRIAIGKRGVERVDPVTSGGSVGGKQFFQKGRLYPTEAEGARTTVYEPDANKRVATYIARVYKAIADTRMANDASLGGQSIADRFSAIKAERATELEGLSPAERSALESDWHTEAAHPLFQVEGRVEQPAFRDKIFPIETANRLKKAFGENSHNWVRNAEKISRTAKTAMLTLDLSAPLTQGLPILYSSPTSWKRAVVQSLKSLGSKESLGRYLSQPENAAAAGEMAQLGVSLRQLQDYMAGAEKGEALTKVPVLGRAVEATGRSFGAFLDTAKVELWKAFREVTPKEQWPQMAETIENMMLSGRMESTGMHPGRAVGERLMMLAPSYYRGATGLIATAAQNGASGAAARKALAHFGAGLSLTMYAAYKASGFSDEEIERRFDMGSGKFLKYPVTMPNGKTMEIGLGGVYVSMARLAGDSYEAATGEQPVGTGVENDPWLRFLRAKAGPIPGLATDVITGRDFMGNEISKTKAALQRVTPITIQQAIAGAKDGAAVAAADAAPSFFGAQAFVETDYQSKQRATRELAQEKFGKRYQDLTVAEQAKVQRAIQQDDRFATKESAALRIRELAAKAQFDREKRVNDGLSGESQKKLKALQIRVPGYDPEISFGSVRFPMTEKQREAYESTLIAEFDKTVKAINEKSWSSMRPAQRQVMLDARLGAARERAKAAARKVK